MRDSHTAAPSVPYGLLAEFIRPEEVLAAANRAREEGYTRMDAFSPYPVEGLAHAIGRSRSWIALVFLIGGLAGGAGGYFMEWYAMAVDYPLNVAGRPLNSWPMFIPVTFEMTVLFAALSGVVALFFSARLPRPHHPVFNAPGFDRATDDRFFLCIESADPKFSPAATRAFLEAQHPQSVVEVPR